MLRHAILGLGMAMGLAGQTLAQPLTVVELFTSQGCSSCPPADANLADLARRPDILALSFGVTYWDDLGWKDTFAQKAFTQRQWDYARGLHHDNVATPQMVINGRTDVVGARLVEVDRAMRSVGAAAGGPVVSLTAGGVSIGAAARPARPAQVWLVRYEAGTIQVPVKRGENTGKTLPISHVVRELTKIGAFDGRAQTLRLPPTSNPGLKTAVLIQAGPGGPILAVAKG